MASGIQTTISNSSGNTHNYSVKREPMNPRPFDYKKKTSFNDKLRNGDLLTKVYTNLDTATSIPVYALRGMKGDPDFNFYEYLKVSKIPYYLGGIGLAAVTLGGRNNIIPALARDNTKVFKKMLTGVLMYYIFKDLASAAVDIPVKLFRGIDLNMPFKKITSLREGNPLGLPNNKKPSNQTIFESTEFTRWDLLYKHEQGHQVNETFDKLAKKFGAYKKLNDSDSYLMSKINKLQIMATSWKYMMSVPFVMFGLGLAQQESFENTDFQALIRKTIELFKPSTQNRFINWTSSFKENIAKPIGSAFVSLWQGKSLAGKILGRTAIIGSVGMALLANIMILNKTRIKDNDKNDMKSGGRS